LLISASGVIGSDKTVFEPELHRTWSAADEEGHHAENLRMIEGMLDVRPDDPDLHLLHAMSLLALGRRDDVLAPCIARSIAEKMTPRY
jgi:hypothetical protein